MNTYKGTVRGNTIILEEKVDLPEGIKARVIIKPIKPTPKRAIKEQVRLMEEAPQVGKRLYQIRDELHER